MAAHGEDASHGVAGAARRVTRQEPMSKPREWLGQEVGSDLGQLALRRLLSAPAHATGCPKLRRASANQPLKTALLPRCRAAALPRCRAAALPHSLAGYTGLAFDKARSAGVRPVAGRSGCRCRRATPCLPAPPQDLAFGATCRGEARSNRSSRRAAPGVHGAATTPLGGGTYSAASASRPHRPQPPLGPEWRSSA